MYNFNDPTQDKRIVDILKTLQAMPNYLIIEGNENQYRENVLKNYNVSEEAITQFIGMNKVFGISLDEHAIELQEIAYEFRVGFREKVEKTLSLCFDEDEKLECLRENDSNYSRWAHETDMWKRHQFKSFNEFAQWHIEQGGWQSDFQGLKFEEFARSWALESTRKWVSKQITEIGTRRVEETDRQAGAKLEVSKDKSEEKAPEKNDTEIEEKLIEVPATVRKILAPLGGKNPQKQAIMSDTEFQRLIKYTDLLVLDNTLPIDIQPIPRTNISNEHIRFTFYLLHSELFGKPKRPAFFKFIHSVFEQFNGTKEETTKRKFSTPPKAYEKDFAGYFGDLK